MTLKIVAQERMIVINRTHQSKLSLSGDRTDGPAGWIVMAGLDVLLRFVCQQFDQMLVAFAHCQQDRMEDSCPFVSSSPRSSAFLFSPLSFILFTFPHIPFSCCPSICSAHHSSSWWPITRPDKTLSGRKERYRDVIINALGCNSIMEAATCWQNVSSQRLFSAAHLMHLLQIGRVCGF